MDNIKKLKDIILELNEHNKDILIKELRTINGIGEKAIFSLIITDSTALNPSLLLIFAQSITRKASWLRRFGLRW